jgi:hypothetical protein
VIFYFKILQNNEVFIGNKFIMKKIIKLNESDLRRIVSRVINEHDSNIVEPTGQYYTLGGFYFYVDGGKMCLADKSNGELSPNLSVEFPSTTELSAEWTQKTQEVDDENIKGKELSGLAFDPKMKNAINYGKYIYGKNQAIVNFGSMIPVLFFSTKYNAPTLGGVVVGTEFPQGVEGKLNLIDAKPGNKIFFQQSAFKQGKEYGIRLEVSMHGQPISLKDFGISQNMMKLPKTYNIGDFFAENSATPHNLHTASFVDTIKSFIKDGGKINRIMVNAATSKMPAGHVDNDTSNSKWSDVMDYDDMVVGNNDDGTGNLQLCKAKAHNTYNELKKAIPELVSAPFVLKAAGPLGEYVHIKFE